MGTSSRIKATGNCRSSFQLISIRLTSIAIFSLCLIGTSARLIAAEKVDTQHRPGEFATDKAGRTLNLGFESGNLNDWTFEGDAFSGQPIKGNTITPRRGDMASDHQGEFWIGTYEVDGDEPTGTLTSVAFPVRQPWASFLIGGGGSPETFVEIVHKESGKVISQAVGQSSENLKPLAVDLSVYLGQDIFIRLVDRDKGSWGHINFDDFRFHPTKPDFPLAFSKVDPDQYAHAGLTPEGAAQSDDRA